MMSKSEQWYWDNSPVPKKIADELNELARRERELHKEVEDWYLANLKELSEACQTREELNRLWGFLTPTDAEGRFQDLPFPINIARLFEADRIKELEKAKLKDT